MAAHQFPVNPRRLQQESERLAPLTGYVDRVLLSLIARLLASAVSCDALLITADGLEEYQRDPWAHAQRRRALGVLIDALRTEAPKRVDSFIMEGLDG
jgi:hypothetical protein